MKLLHLGDNMDMLKSLPDDSVDFLCTDPPYGYSFMGKDWDRAVPGVAVWQECLRVLKPGAFACVMSAPRSDVWARMVGNLGEAGFRLDFSPMMWCYATGFPKAQDAGKLADRRMGAKRAGKPVDLQKKTAYMSNAGNHRPWMDNPDHLVAGDEPVTDEARRLDGAYVGFQPKPAWEPVIVAMKPLGRGKVGKGTGGASKSFIDQALENGKGVTWLGDGRIPFDGEGDKPSQEEWNRRGAVGFDRQNLERLGEHTRKAFDNALSVPDGRFPANLLVSDAILNNGTISLSSTPRSSSTPNAHDREKVRVQNSSVKRQFSYGDGGGFSRYFSLDAWWGKRVEELPDKVRRVLPFLIVPKPSKSERDRGLEGGPDGDGGLEIKQKVWNGGSGESSAEMKDVEKRFSTSMRNIHPTAKPIMLMSYLVTLFSRPGDVVMDPFAGSGTTLIAAEMLGRGWAGAEMEEQYWEIARRRLRWMEEAPKQMEMGFGGGLWYGECGDGECGDGEGEGDQDERYYE